MSFADRIEIEEVPALRLRSPGERLQATVIPSAGMLIYSLKRGDTELLHRGHSLADYTERGTTIAIPFLHPWANRLPGLSYSVAGQAVELDPETLPINVIEGTRPIHGMRPGGLPWEAGEPAAQGGHTTLEARATFDDSLPQFPGFPFSHLLIYSIALSDDALSVTVTAEVPADAAPMPVAFGFHPYLQLPGTDRADWKINLPFTDQVVLDDQMPTGEVRAIDPIAGKLADRTFDDGFIAPGKPLDLSDLHNRLVMEMDAGYRYAQVYTPAGAQFICYEPMTSSVDPFNSPDTPIVEPGLSYAATFVLSVQNDESPTR